MRDASIGHHLDVFNQGHPITVWQSNQNPETVTPALVLVGLVGIRHENMIIGVPFPNKFENPNQVGITVNKKNQYGHRDEVLWTISFAEIGQVVYELMGPTPLYAPLNDREEVPLLPLDSRIQMFKSTRLDEPPHYLCLDTSGRMSLAEVVVRSLMRYESYPEIPNDNTNPL